MISCRHLWRLLALLAVGVLLFTSPSGKAAAQSKRVSTESGVLTLVDGSKLVGELQQTDSSDSIRWHADGFLEPFHFPADSVRSIVYDRADLLDIVPGSWAVELSNRDILIGTLHKWSDNSLSVKSQSLGDVTVPVEHVQRMHRVTDGSNAVLANLVGMQNWKGTRWQLSEWEVDGTALKSQESGAILRGNAGIPDRAVIEIELEWQGPPSFVMSLGVPRDAKLDNTDSGWRFEVWGKTLVAVCERNDVADIRGMVDVSQKSGVHLIVYLDQKADHMQVYDGGGNMLGEVSGSQADAGDAKQDGAKGMQRRERKGESPATHEGMQLLCQRGNLVMKRLRVTEWNGHLPTHTEDREHTIMFSDGSSLTVNSFKIDAEAGMIHFPSASKISSRQLGQVTRITRSGKDSTPDPSGVTVSLKDGTRLSGELRQIGAGEVQLSVELDGRQVTVPIADTAAFTFRSPENPPSDGDVPQLKLQGQMIRGQLAELNVSDTPPEDSLALAWRPVASRNSSRLRDDVSGRILFRKSLGIRLSAAEQRTMQEIKRQTRRKAALRGVWQPKSSGTVPVTPSSPNALHFRSGDVLPCSVKWITEYGVYVESDVLAEETLVPHDQIKTIELSSVGSTVELEPKKKERLLTIPRMQAASPPTHLLVSKNNDFLRCRLVSMDDVNVRIELQLEEVEVSRERIRTIIWLHPDEAEPPEGAPPSGVDAEQERVAVEEPDSDSQQRSEGASNRATSSHRFEGLIQVIRFNGSRVTFEPTGFDGETILGTSKILGECRLAEEEIGAILIGSAITEMASELPQLDWQLEHAKLPLVARESPTEEMGTGSPLVGLEAPEIDLELLDGGRFRLSEHRGQIVVLDFWATWCAPCMQTIPELELVMGQYDPSQVRFISVNMQEQPDQIRQVLERQELDLTVALDVDGVAALRYNATAIPQLVVIDEEGRVAQLYIGGGSKVVASLSGAVDEMLAAEEDAS